MINQDIMEISSYPGTALDNKRKRLGLVNSFKEEDRSSQSSLGLVEARGRERFEVEFKNWRDILTPRALSFLSAGAILFTAPTFLDWADKLLNR